MDLQLSHHDSQVIIPLCRSDQPYNQSHQTENHFLKIKKQETETGKQETNTEFQIPETGIQQNAPDK